MKQKTIVVADDDPGIREMFEEWLCPYGFRVISRGNGAEVLDNGIADEADLVLLDVRMPGLDGFEVCRRLKSQPQTRLTPVVLVTALSATKDYVEGLEAGADDFLTKPVNELELLARVRSLLRLKEFTDELENAEAVLCSLALSIEAKDPYTEGHCARLSHYSVALAERIGLTEEQCVALRRAGIVHDIGKVAVPEQILLKPGPLSPEEQKIMEQHPVAGERICAPLKSFRLVLPIIRHHHEKFDGSGYPDGLRGEQIPLTARVLQLVDVYDALTTERPYRHALAMSEALVVMEEEVNRGWWDPSLFPDFQGLLTQSSEFPSPACRK